MLWQPPPAVKVYLTGTIPKTGNVLVVTLSLKITSEHSRRFFPVADTVYVADRSKCLGSGSRRAKRVGVTRVMEWLGRDWCKQPEGTAFFPTQPPHLALPTTQRLWFNSIRLRIAPPLADRQVRAGFSR